jgi:hypothetical protein
MENQRQKPTNVGRICSSDASVQNTKVGNITEAEASEYVSVGKLLSTSSPTWANVHQD